MNLEIIWPLEHALKCLLLNVDQILEVKTQQTTKVNVKVQLINRLFNVVCESQWANAESATCNESLRLLQFPFFFAVGSGLTSAGFGKGEL